MRLFIRLLRQLGWVLPLGACAFLVWINAARWEHIVSVSALGENEKPAIDASSPTGYAGGVRELILPEPNHDGYQWIAQTQQMLSRGEWRLRHVDYDNAPFGRTVRTPSPYRWWLARVAWVDHAVSGRPLLLAVEHAALVANPALHALLLLSAGWYVARRLGGLAGGVVAVGLAALFPFSCAFLAGAPDDHALALVAVCGSIFPLVVGATRRGLAAKRAFFLAGMAGAAGLWVSVAAEAPVIAGVALGGLFTACATRRARPATDAAAASTAVVRDPLPWRSWALGGAVTTLLAYLLEFFPGARDLRVDAVHPLYALAWMGAGELLLRSTVWIQQGAPAPERRDLPVILLALLALGGLPAAIVLQSRKTADLLFTLANGSQLSATLGSTAADNLGAWILRDGLTLPLAATLLPLLLLVPMALWLRRQQGDESAWRPVGLALGPVAVTCVLACVHLRAWSLVDGALVGLAAALAAALSSAPAPNRRQGGIAAAMLVAVIPGLVLLLRAPRERSAEAVTESEVVGLIGRDFAHWLAQQTGGTAVVFAPPELTTVLSFHGGLRGLGSPYPENKDGFDAAVRIAGASSADEALALVQRRGITHLVLPSWDGFMDEYARLGSGQPDKALIEMLHQWLPPRWLKPVPYVLPKIPGFEGQSLVVFQVVELQENAEALSRLAEYFVEMGQMDLAVSVAEALQTVFPHDVGASVARAQVDFARGRNAEATATMVALLPQLKGEQVDALPWDRRVGLALALARGDRNDAAREQLQRCWAEIDATRIRSLTTATLYRFLSLGKAYQLEIADAELRSLARGLVPVELRERI